MQQPKIILSHETFQSVGSWAITPILAASNEYIDKIINSHRDSDASKKANLPKTKHNVSKTATNGKSTSSKPIETKWLILCEDQSIVDLKALINNLKNEDYTKVSSMHNFIIIFAVCIKFRHLHYIILLNPL